VKRITTHDNTDYCDRRLDFDAWPSDFVGTAPTVEIFSESVNSREHLTVHALFAPPHATSTISAGNRVRPTARQTD
jgi:hypothetical protein